MTLTIFGVEVEILAGVCFNLNHRIRSVSARGLESAPKTIRWRKAKRFSHANGIIADHNMPSLIISHNYSTERGRIVVDYCDCLENAKYRDGFLVQLLDFWRTANSSESCATMSFGSPSRKRTFDSLSARRAERQLSERSSNSNSDDLLMSCRVNAFCRMDWLRSSWATCFFSASLEMSVKNGARFRTNS